MSRLRSMNAQVEIRPLELATVPEDRKLRLQVCAACRIIAHLVTDPRCRRAIEVAERYADGVATVWGLEESHEHAGQALKLLAVQEGAAVLNRLKEDWGQAFDAARYAARAVWFATGPQINSAGVEIATECACRAAQRMGGADAYQAACGRLDAIAADLHGSALSSPDPSWLRWNDGAVLRIAQAIYADRWYADLPILADALEEAGCTNGDILEHCRSDGEHHRGCWVVDLLIGKQ